MQLTGSLQSRGYELCFLVRPPYYGVSLLQLTGFIPDGSGITTPDTLIKPFDFVMIGLYKMASLVRRVGGALGNGVKFFLFRFWRGNDQDLQFFDLFWRTLRIFFLNCWKSLSPSVKVLKKDLFKLAKMAFSRFHLFLEKMIRKGVFFLLESLKRLWKNDRFFNQISFYLAVGFIIWAVFSILKWVLKLILKKKKKK